MSPPKKEAGAEHARRKPTSTFSQSSMSMERRRSLELLCLLCRAIGELDDKLSDITALNQQQTDLLRRIVKERAL